MNASAQQPDEATVTAYLANRLDQTRAEDFEAYCLGHPEFAHRVELDLLMKEGLRQTQEADRVRRGHRRRIQWAIAASLLLVVGCAVLLLPRLHPGTLVVYRSAAEVPASLLSGPRVSVTLIRLRGGSGARRVTAPRDAGALLVRVEPDSPPGPSGYAASVTPEPGMMSRSVFVDDLHTDADGYIEMYLPLAAVVGQTVKVTVNPSPPTAGGEPLSFRLQIAYPQNPPALTP